MRWDLERCVSSVQQINSLVCRETRDVGRAVGGVEKGGSGPPRLPLKPILYRNAEEVETSWVSASRKLVLVAKLPCVVSLLSGSAVAVAAGMDVVRAARGKCPEPCAYLSIAPALSGTQRPAAAAGSGGCRRLAEALLSQQGR